MTVVPNGPARQVTQIRLRLTGSEYLSIGFYDAKVMAASDYVTVSGTTDLTAMGGKGVGEFSICVPRENVIYITKVEEGA